MKLRELLALDTREVVEKVENFRKVSFEELMRMVVLVENDAIDEKRNRRRQRLNDCGSPACRLDPHTGEHYWFSQKCGLFRLCSYCLEDRAHDIKNKIQEYIASGNQVKIISLSPRDAKRFCRPLDKSEYERFPTEEGGDIVFYSASAKVAEEFESRSALVTIESTNDLDWITLALTPEKRNKSGKLTTPVQSSLNQEFEYVRSPSLVSDAPIKEQGLAMEMARSRTADFDPKTAEEVEQALNDRMWTAYRILKSMGYNPRMYYGMQKIVLAQISWLNNHTVKRKKQHRKSSFEQLKLPLMG